MPLQSVEDGGPSWDTKGVVDAGVRATPMVTSIQDAMLAQVETAPYRERTFQEALEAQVLPSESIWQRGTGSEDGDRYAGAVLGAVQAKTTGDDVYDTIDKSIDHIAASPDAAADIYSSVADGTTESVKRQLNAMSGVAPKDQATMVGVFEELKRWKLDNDMPWGFEAFTEEQLNDLSAMRSPEASALTKERIFLKHGRALAAKEWDAHGKLDAAIDLAKLFVLPGTTLAMSNFTEKFDPKSVGKIVNGLDETVGRITDLSIDGKGFKAYKSTLEQFWKLPVEKRLLSLNNIDKHIKEIAGSNTFVYMSMMMPFVEHSEQKSVELDYLLDNLTLASLFPGRTAWKVLKFANQVKNARKPIQILKDTGNVGDAAAVLNKALIDVPQRSIKVTGMHKAELAASAQPVDISNAMPSQIQGVAKEAAEQLGSEILATTGRIDQEFAKMVNPDLTARRYYFDETAKVARQKEVLDQVGTNATYPTYARITERTDDGFTVTVDYGSKFAGTHDAESLKAANLVHEQHINDLHEQANTYRSGAKAVEPTSFKTAKGSTYDVQGNTTKRTKKVGKDAGPQPRSQATYYATEAQAKKMLDGGTVDASKLSTTPAVGKSPVELFGWDGTKYTGKHIGHSIISMDVPPVDPEIVRIQDQIRASKEQIKKNVRIIKDLEAPPKTTSIPVKYTFKQAGAHEVEELQRGTFPHIASPSQVVDQLHKQVGDATLAEFLETKLLGQMHTTSRDFIRGTTSAQRKDVDKILLWGDELGRNFGVDELIDGVATKWGVVKLDSTKSISLYYGMRRMFDNLHRIKNIVQTRELEASGFKQMVSKLLNSKGEAIKLFAKEAGDEVGVARSSSKIPDSVKRIYDHQTGNIVDVTPELEKKLSKDWKVVRFRHGYRFGDEVINYGIVNPEKHFKPITGRVIDYRPGYVPKQRPGVFYTATKKSDMLVDGLKAPRFSTERFFRTESEASQWWASLPSEERAAIQILPDKRYKHSAYETHDEEWDALNFGGMFTGERTDRSILMGLDGEQAHRTSSYKALSLYMGHVANRFSTNELKMNLIHRFQNTYGDYLQNPGNWKSPLKVEYHNDLSLARAVNAQRDYIKDIIRLPDPMQDWWNTKMRNIAEVMEGGVLGGKPRDWVMNMGQRDPTAALRTATFHIYLGFFNMSQFLVQGMGAATAMSAYPLKAARLLPKNVGLRAAWAMRDNPKAMTEWFDAVGLDGPDMARIVKEIERVGLFDSLKTSADYNAGINGISVTSDAARRVLESGLLPFREGEQFSRGYGYLLARDNFLSGKKKGYIPTDKDVDMIAKDSLRFTLNLNRSNKAFWQGAQGQGGIVGGLLSIPSQFMQVFAKFAENMIGGTFGYGNRVWTTGEKAKIMLGSFAMSGMAGVPFMDNAVSSMVQMYREATNDTQQMTNDRINPFNGVAGLDDATVARAIQGGLVQVMAHWLTGSDPELATRFSIAGGLEETIDMYNHGDKDLLSALGGAMAPGLGRGFDAIVGLGRIFNPVYSDDLSDEQVKMAVRKVAGMLSSTRNADKAYWWWKMQAITNNKGQKVMELPDDEFNNTLLWQALGFGPAKVGWMYDDKESTKELEQRITKATKDINTVLDEYYLEPNLRASEQKDKFLNKVVSLRLEGYTPTEREKVMKGVKTHLADDKQRLIEAIADSVKATADAGGRTTSGNFANPLHVPAGE